MHILILSDNFPPEVNAPASRTYEHCREWVSLGYQVTVITCAPNFPRGRVYEGYTNKLWDSEIIDGIRVVRVWTYLSANEGFVRRTLDFMSYMMAAILAAPFISKVDLVVGTSPQFFTVCAARVVALYKRVPWIFELRDIWPESIRVVGAMQNSKILDFLEKLELYLYRSANAIVTVTHSFKSALVCRGIDAAKIHVVTNGVDTSCFSPRGKDKELLAQYELEGKFVVGYIGTQGMAHALDTYLDCAVELKNSASVNYVFLLIGDGADNERLRERQRTENIDNVVFINSVPKGEISRYWSLLDCSVIHLRKKKLFESVIPSKMFESMGMGVPILHGVIGESARIVENENVGIVFEPENSADLCIKLDRLASSNTLSQAFKLNGPVAAKNYERRHLAAKITEVFRIATRAR